MDLAIGRFTCLLYFELFILITHACVFAILFQLALTKSFSIIFYAKRFRLTMYKATDFSIAYMTRLLFVSISKI